MSRGTCLLHQLRGRGKSKPGCDMSDPYQTAKGGRLTFKGGVVATRSKAIDKKKKKKKAKHNKDLQFQPSDDVVLEGDAALEAGEGGGAVAEPDVYTIDAAKKMKYEELFPVETRKFGYDSNNNKPNFKSVEDALDDRVKKKADRYCK